MSVPISLTNQCNFMFLGNHLPSSNVDYSVSNLVLVLARSVKLTCEPNKPRVLHSKRDHTELSESGFSMKAMIGYAGVLVLACCCTINGVTGAYEESYLVENRHLELNSFKC